MFEPFTLIVPPTSVSSPKSFTPESWKLASPPIFLRLSKLSIYENTKSAFPPISFNEPKSWIDEL